jgi:cell division protein FtsB
MERHLEADRNSINAIACSFAHVRILTEPLCRSIQPSINKEKQMFTKRTVLRVVGASLAVLLSTAAQPLRAQSDAERLQKLEQAVSQLQKRNAELEQEVAGLKKRTSWAPALAPESKTKTQVSSEGKTYVEKLVPELHGGEKWKLFPAITELELFGDLRLR